MRCGRTGALGMATGVSLVISVAFGVSVRDTSRVVLVGDEVSLRPSAGVMSGFAVGSGLSLVFLRW